MTDPTHGQDGQGDYDIWGADFGKVGIDDVTDNRIREPQPMAKPPCEHHWIGHVRGGASLSVRICSFCGKPDFADLDRQADELSAAGYAAAVANLRDVAQRTGSPAARWAADYLEAVGPGASGPESSGTQGGGDDRG